METRGKQRTDIEWNMKAGEIEEGDIVRFTDNWCIAFFKKVPEVRINYEVLQVEPFHDHMYSRITIGAYGKAGTKGMYESQTMLKNLELVAKGHKPLKDLGPLV